MKLEPRLAGLRGFLFMHKETRAFEALSRAERGWREAQEAIRATLDAIGDGVIATDAAGRITRMNPVAEALTGWREAEALGQPVSQVFHIVNEETRTEVENLVDRLLRESKVVSLANHTLLIAKDGTERPIADNAAPIRNEKGEIFGFVVTFRDLTKERRSLAALQKSRDEAALLLDVIEQSSQPLGVGYPDGRLGPVNPAFCRLVGYTKEELQAIDWGTVLTPPEWLESARRKLDELHQTGQPFRYQKEYVRKDGTRVLIELFVHLVRDEHGKPRYYYAFIDDITERRRADAEKDRLLAQLVQAKKMESVGRLAGGVAHDFNNMLGVIIGHAELALGRVDSSQPLHGDLEEIRRAAKHSADLTRQLLAFARKQTVSPKVLDLNETVSGMLNMLRRLIGEEIELVWKPAVNLWPVRIDPAQIDQILANLLVNARDAITGIGTVTVETRNTVLDETYCEHHAGFVPGQYVLLAVSDTGPGLGEHVLEHLFEPFFTTKEVGRGTGLGLAMVYGIVKQNKGFINAYSEPGYGVAFKIYLPRAEGAVAVEPAAVVEKPIHGTETVLLVEDEEAILKLGKRILERHGYTVLPAGTPSEAVALAERQKASIDLLITDVVMPEMNGRALMEKISAIRPGLRTLFMSGYTTNVIAQHGVLHEGVHFLQKPFSVRALLEKVREVLEG